MRAAHHPIQRPESAKLLIVDEQGTMRHVPRSTLAEHLRPGDLLVANDAATMPAGLHGVHEPSGERIEIRLAARDSLDFEDVRGFTAIVFGAGDHRTRTEDRPAPPELRAGDPLTLGPLRATVVDLLDHARLIRLRFEDAPRDVWAGIASHGHPVQYAHIHEPLALWDVWTPVASRAVAFEPPSAGFMLDWRMLDRLRERGIGFATLTHAAGLSSTGDSVLDARLPLDEPYVIPEATVRAIERTRSAGGRVVALGTTVTRALEHGATEPGGLAPGHGLADNRLGPQSELRIVDLVLTGTHEPGESHYQLLHAFADGELLSRVSTELESRDYRTHEFGDSVLMEKQRVATWARIPGWGVPGLGEAVFSAWGHHGSPSP